MSRLETKVYQKPTDTGLVLHYQSHIDVRFFQWKSEKEDKYKLKQGLLRDNSPSRDLK